MNVEKKPYSKMKCFAAGVISSAALFVSFDTNEPYESHIGDPIRQGLFRLFEYTTDAFSGKAFIISLVAICLFFVYKELLGDSEKRLYPVRHEMALSFFFSFMYLGGRAFRQGNSLGVLISPRYNIFKAAILLFGFYYLFVLFVRGLAYLLDNNDRVFVIGSDRFKGVRELYRKHPYLFVFLTVIICWLPHLIFRYPGALAADDWSELQFFFGVLPYSSWQPIFHTWLMGSFADAGMELFGSTNSGLFILVCLQATAMAAVLAYTVFMMYKWRIPLWYRLFVLFLYCFTPYFTGNAAWIIKDYPHMIGYVMWSLCIIRIVLDGKREFSFKDDLGLLVSWVLGASFMMLCRNNGKYIYVFMTLVLAVIWVVRIIRKKESFGLYLLLMAILPLVITGTINHAITVHYNVVKGSVGEALCLPLQQTARYVTEHYDELTDEEIEILSSVLYWDEFSRSYDPTCADPVKMWYRQGSEEHLPEYFGLWLRQFFKHPMTYIQATWNQSYFIFMPDYDNVVYNQDCDAGKSIVDEVFKDWINIHVPESMQGFPIMICSMYRMLNRLPFIAMLNNLAIYIYVMLVLRRLMQDKGLVEGRIALGSLWLSLIFVFMSPLIENQPRYSWAIIYILPTIVAMYMFMSNRTTRGEG